MQLSPKTTLLAVLLLILAVRLAFTEGGTVGVYIR